MISRVGHSGAAYASTTNLDVSIPAGIQSGDYAVCVLSVNGPRTVTDDNGTKSFIQLATLDYNGPSASIEVWGRLLDGTETGNFKFNLSAGNRCSIACSVYRGVDQTTPVEVSPVTNSSSGTTITCPSIVTSVDDCALICAGVFDSSIQTFNGYPSGYTVLQELLQQTLGLADKLTSTSGTQSSVTWTSSAGNGWASMHMALKPAATGTDVTASVSADSLSGTEPAITVTAIRNTTISAGVDVSNIGDPSVTINVQQQVVVYPSTDALAAGDPAPTIVAQRNISIPLSADGISITDLAATILTEQSVDVAVGADTLNIADLGVSIVAQRNVTIAVDAESVSSSDPSTTVALGVLIQALAETLNLGDPGVTIAAVRNVTISEDGDVIATGDPSVTAIGSINTTIPVGADEIILTDLGVAVTILSTTQVGVDALGAVEPAITVLAIRNISSAVAADAITSSDPDVEVDTATPVIVAVGSDELTGVDLSVTVETTRSVTIPVDVDFIGAYEIIIVDGRIALRLAGEIYFLTS